jgi:thioredoxin 1
MTANEKTASPIEITDADFDEIVKKHQLILVDFWAEWCGPCRMMEPVMEELAKDHSGKIVFGKLNVEQNPKTAARFGVMSIPTFLLFKKSKMIDRITGAVPKQMIEERISKFIE